ncbi:MAG: energy transducer TonB [Acidobacteria bacterium]|nr:energy transducer TonB [Acidobacteriota bacterium]
MKLALFVLPAALLLAEKISPQLLSKIEPQFSEEARKAKWAGGTVTAKIQIDEKGNVTDVQVVEHPGLGIDRQTVAAVKQWKFKPAMEGGKPVKTHGTVTVQFKSW